MINKFYQGSNSKFKDDILKGSASGPLYINTVKMFHQKDCKNFDVFGRVFSGTIHQGQKVRIFGEAY